jgi:magnesium-transporting ATPase (P-type)
MTEEEVIESKENPEIMEQGLILLGILGIQDPLREGVPQSVLKAAKAGISVRMVTGDNIETATAISKKANIIPENYSAEKFPGLVMEGPEFRKGIEFHEDTITEEE